MSASKTVRVRYLTTARGPSYRHDEGQVDRLPLDRARELVAAGIAELVDPPVHERAPEEEPEAARAAEPETADLRPAEQATAPPQRRVGARRRPADHEPERPAEG